MAADSPSMEEDGAASVPVPQLRPSEKLPPTRDLNTVLNRFSRFRRPFHPVERKAFNADTFEKKSHAHNEAYQIAKRFRLTDASGSTIAPISVQKPVVIRNVATFQENFFLKGAVSGRLISVPNAEMRDVMLRRNFVLVKCDHFTDPAQLPQEEVRTDMSSDELLAAPVPFTLTIPDLHDRKGKLPSLWKHNRDETTAEATVRAFEERVIFNGAVFSPYRLWTEKERKAKGLKDTGFTKRCQVYYAVRKLRMDQPPPEITENISTLAAAATANPPTSHDGSNVTWFDAAVQVANERISSNS